MKSEIQRLRRANEQRLRMLDRWAGVEAFKRQLAKWRKQLALPRDEPRWCAWCGETLQKKAHEDGYDFRRRRFCDVRCAGAYGNETRREMKHTKHQEPYPKCTQCQTVRPPEVLKDGVCSDGWCAKAMQAQAPEKP